ncbi:MAG: hypothetical protein HZA35_01535 [Parcubacteria group bacterium]|nr:hypothetical protein [Parcubacteria group bacterium]
MAQVEMYRVAELPHEEIHERFTSHIAQGVKTEEGNLQEIKERSKELKLNGQVTLVGHRIDRAKKDLVLEHSLYPERYYPKISPDEMKLWEMWLPELCELEDYGERPNHYFIPESVLDEYEALKKLKLFVRYVVRACHHKKGYELLLMGLGENGAFFRIARWGERLVGGKKVSSLVGKVSRRQKLRELLFGSPNDIQFVSGSLVTVTLISMLAFVFWIDFVTISFMQVILDNIRSVHNVGSIFRTSDAVGVEKVYLCGITPTPVDRFGNLLNDFAKTALGAEKSVPYEKVSSTWRCIEKLKKEGFFVIALEQTSGAQNLFTTKRMRLNLTHLVVVIGNEVKGVSKSALERADAVIEIPMVGKKESLNVAVAFGIAAYQLTFKNQKSKRKTSTQN